MKHTHSLYLATLVLFVGNTLHAESDTQDKARQTSQHAHAHAPLAATAKKIVKDAYARMTSQQDAITRDITSNDSQLFLNQYGKNSDIPGVFTLKSRGVSQGDLSPVKPGDVIGRYTATGVADNLTTPSAATLSFNVPTNGVPGNKGWVASEFEVQLTSLNGPSNGLRPVFKISSEGVPQYLETTSKGAHATVPSGIAVLNSMGKATIANATIPANARILLTAQPTKAPKGSMYVSAIAPLTSFTIASTSGGTDSGVNVYYQIYMPLP